MKMRQRLGDLVKDESGQIIPIVTVMIIALLGVSALGIDTGHAMFSDRQLQAATDSAALAGAQAMLTAANPAAVVGTGGVGGVVGAYSSVTGAYNQRASLPSVTENATLLCLSTLTALGQPCIGSVPYNAVQVTQTSVIPLFFAGLMGKTSVTIKAVSTAAARGGSPRPSNVAIILDTTLSANSVDTDCLNSSGQALTEMQCGLNGVQVLLQALQPCGANQATCSPSGGVAVNSFDRVALFTFPNVTLASAYQNANCTTPVPAATSSNGYWNTAANIPNNPLSNFNFVMPTSPTGQTPITPYADIPNAAAYTFPTVGATSYTSTTGYLATNPETSGSITYEVTAFVSDYRTSVASTTLNASSSIVMAAGGGGANCGGMAPPNYDGVYGTYYAGAIYAAQAALTYQAAQNAGTENIMIIISDGDATSPQNWGSYYSMPSPATASGTYPSYVNECNQGVTAARYATSQGTTVYSVAYGSPSVGCLTDISPAITPCAAMAAMASAPQEFYSDYKQSGSASTCVASQPVVALADIFASIAGDLTEARLIPNNTQ